MTLLEKMSLSDLQQKQRLIGPLNYHDRFNLTLPPEKSILQHQLLDLVRYTAQQSMVLNEKKTKNMIVNFSKKYQFTTQLSVNDIPIELVRETKLLGTHLTENLKWDKNTSEIVKNAWKRMQLFFRAASFTSNKADLRKIYLTFVRSILEQSAVVWHSSLTEKNRVALERVQKAAVKVMMGNNYKNYKDGLKNLNLDNLNSRREDLCLRFAKKSTQNEKMKSMFPKNIRKHV